jgi:hypothetical protein
MASLDRAYCQGALRANVIPVIAGNGEAYMSKHKRACDVVVLFHLETLTSSISSSSSASDKTFNQPLEALIGIVVEKGSPPATIDPQDPPRTCHQVGKPSLARSKFSFEHFFACDKGIHHSEENQLPESVAWLFDSIHRTNNRERSIQLPKIMSGRIPLANIPRHQIRPTSSA